MFFPTSISHLIGRFSMFDIFRRFLTTSSDGGKPLLRQLFEALQLRLRPCPLGISEYLDYGLWRRNITSAMRKEFLGWRQNIELDKLFNDDSSRVLANDKLMTYLILRTAGYPIPEPVATYTAEGRRIYEEIVLQSEDDVNNFVNGRIFPLYVKPISAGYGRDVMGLEGRIGDSFHMMDGTIISREQLIAPFRFLPYRGMLFQKPLKAHPSIADLTGCEAISCVRFICLATSKGPMIHTAFWKIVSGHNMVDNFSHGNYGNCLGAIAIETGKIVRAISKMGPGGLIDQHPNTKKTLIGFTLPDWSLAKDLVLSATRHFPGLRLQNWDVSLCPQGPVLLELNTESELNVPQAISGHGFKDSRLLDSLKELLADKAAHRRAVSMRDAMQ